MTIFNRGMICSSSDLRCSVTEEIFVRYIRLLSTNCVSLICDAWSERGLCVLARSNVPDKSFVPSVVGRWSCGHVNLCR